MRVLAGVSAAVLLVFVVACGGGSSSGPTTGPAGDTSAPGGATAAPGGATAAAGGFTCSDGATAGAPVIAFSGTHGATPTDASVSAGGAVTFTNNSSTNHQIEFGTSKCSTFLLVGKSITVTFSAAGTYKWTCLIHPSYESGTITVS